jgi:hypothetical protein
MSAVTWLRRAELRALWCHTRWQSNSTLVGQTPGDCMPKSYGMLTKMARAALQYGFAALLALLSLQATVPSAQVVAAIEIACRSEAQQPLPSEARRVRASVPVRRSALTYASRTRPEPAAAVLFQRPPPVPSLFS